MDQDIFDALEHAIETHAEVMLSSSGDSLICQPHVLYADNATSGIKAAVIDLLTNQTAHLTIDDIDTVVPTGRRFHPDRRIDVHNRRFGSAFSKIAKW